jgi:hypothetical protein
VIVIVNRRGRLLPESMRDLLGIDGIWVAKHWRYGCSCRKFIGGDINMEVKV